MAKAGRALRVQPLQAGQDQPAIALLVGIGRAYPFIDEGVQLRRTARRRMVVGGQHQIGGDAQGRALLAGQGQGPWHAWLG